MDRGVWKATVHGVTRESDTTERLTLTLTTYADLGSTKSSTRFDKRAIKILKETILQQYKEQKKSEVKQTEKCVSKDCGFQFLTHSVPWTKRN